MPLVRCEVALDVLWGNILGKGRMEVALCLTTGHILGFVQSERLH